MDLRSIIDKLDTIEKTKLLLESEQLVEKVRIRYSDVEAVAKQYPTDDDARGQALAKLARSNGLTTLFDPVSGELVNADGSYSTFKGADEATVERLKSWGLLPLNAKTSSWLGFRGQDRKTAIDDNQTAQSRDQMVDRAAELIKQAVAISSAPIVAKESIAESLLSSFGYTTSLIESITAKEHEELHTLIQKITPFAKQDPDAADIVAKFNAYNEKRNDLIARINEIIAAIKPATTASEPAPVTAPRAGAASNESVQDLSIAKALALLTEDTEQLCELRATQKGVTIYAPDWKGYISSDQVKHNIAMLKAGKAELDWRDHVGQSVNDFANMATFGGADKVAAYLDSLKKGSKGYDAELGKYRDATKAYSSDASAANVRNAVKGTTGYEIDKDNPLGNITAGDVAGTVASGSGLWKAGTSVASKLGGGKIAQGAGGVAATVAPAVAVGAVGEPTKNAATKESMQTENSAYTVKAGDTLSKIALQMGTDLKTLLKVNPQFQANPNLIKPGQTVNNPKSTQPAAAATTTGSQSGAIASTTNVGEITPDSVKALLAKVGVTGNTITPDQLLSIASMLGISTASESLNEGIPNPLPLLQKGWTGIKSMFGKEAGDAAAGTAGKDAAQTVTGATGKTATDVAGDTLTGATVRKDGITWTQRVDGIWQATDKTGKQILKPNDQMQMMLGKADGKAAAVKRTTDAVNDMVRGGVKARADDAAAATAGSAGSKVVATPGAADTVDKAVSGLSKLGSKFANLVKNNKFLAVLAALTAAGIAINLSYGTDSNGNTGNGNGNSVQPQPAVDPQAEERKRQLLDLEKLLAQLYGGWPTDTETRETIKAAVAAGAKAPEGFGQGGVNTQPANSDSSVGAGVWQGQEVGASAEELVRLRNEKLKSQQPQ